MISPSAWELVQTARIATLVCFPPVLMYRIWRVARYPTSIPAVAAAAFGIWVWFLTLLFTEPVWSAMPPRMHAVWMGGWALVGIAGCLQIFVIGISRDVSPIWIRRGMCATFAVTAVVFVAVGVFATRSHVLVTSEDVQTLSNTLVNGGDRAAVTASVLSSGFLVGVLVQLAWVGFRHADRTPVGTGLGLLAIAAVLELVAFVCGGIWRPLSGGGPFIGGDYGLLLQILPGCVGVVTMIVGFAWPPVLLHIRARRDLRRLWPLHDVLVRIFPGLSPPADTRIRMSDLVFECVAHVHDGLTVLARIRQVPFGSGALVPGGLPQRASAVSYWLVGKHIPGFSCQWLRAPDGVSDEDWALAIADGFRRDGGVLIAGPVRQHLASVEA